MERRMRGSFPYILIQWRKREGLGALSLCIPYYFIVLFLYKVFSNAGFIYLDIVSWSTSEQFLSM